MEWFKKVETKIQTSLSHRPIAYGLIVGVGVVLFWRGVWHTVDTLHIYVNHFWLGYSIDWSQTPWWDGPISFLIGTFVLMMTGVFVSSFIGNEIIISGLRGEKKLTSQTEKEVRTEVGAIGNIRDEVMDISRRLTALEKDLLERERS